MRTLIYGFTRRALFGILTLATATACSESPSAPGPVDAEDLSPSFGTYPRMYQDVTIPAGKAELSW